MEEYNAAANHEKKTISIKEIDNGFMVFSGGGDQICSKDLKGAIKELEKLFTKTEEISDIQKVNLKIPARK